MTEAKLGLIVVAALIIVFAFVMRSMGALRMTGAVTAATVTIAIAAALYLTQ